MFTLRGQAESIAHKSYNDSTKQIKQLGRNTDHLITNLKVSHDHCCSMHLICRRHS